jgi:hypothetical protein
MIFFHIVDDYYLQGWLASAKQKSYWKENAPDKLYEHDYIWALIMHSFSWSFMIMLPIAYVQQFNIDFRFFLLFVFNIAIHAFTDNAKANWKIINLWQDQFVHMVQIFVTSILIYI